MLCSGWSRRLIWVAVPVTSGIGLRVGSVSCDPHPYPWPKPTTTRTGFAYP